MGTAASRQASQGTLRKFPNRPPGSTTTTPTSFPLSSNPAATRRPLPGQQQQPSGVSFAKEEAIRRDGLDPTAMASSSPDNMISPDFARRLGQIGVVQPNPTFSPSSTASTSLSTPSSSSSSSQQQQPVQNSGPIFPSPSHNLVLSALEARERLQNEADHEFQNLGTSSSQGRRFLHAGMIRDVLVMRERGAHDHEVERRFNLKKGVVRSLGPEGLYRPVTDVSA